MWSLLQCLVNVLTVAGPCGARIGSSASPPWTAPTLQWPRFPLSIAVGVGPGSGSPQSVMFLRVRTRTMTRARFQIGNQLPIWNFGGMDASMCPFTEGVRGVALAEPLQRPIRTI